MLVEPNSAPGMPLKGPSPHLAKGGQTLKQIKKMSYGKPKTLSLGV